MHVRVPRGKGWFGEGRGLGRVRRRGEIFLCYFSLELVQTIENINTRSTVPEKS
jgi:hypothetical protein